MGGHIVYSNEESIGTVFNEVERPEHYVKNGLEVIDIIEAFELNYRLGNVAKYVLRHQNKQNPLTDLKKARWYLDREISVRENTIENL